MIRYTTTFGKGTKPLKDEPGRSVMLCTQERVYDTLEDLRKAKKEWVAKWRPLTGNVNAFRVGSHRVYKLYLCRRWTREEVEAAGQNWEDFEEYYRIEKEGDAQ